MTDNTFSGYGDYTPISIDNKTRIPGKLNMMATVNGDEHVMIPKALYDEWVAANDEVLNWADANARWFDISTAPRGQWLLTYRTGDSRATMAQLGFGDEWISPSGHTTVTSHAYLPPTHWRPLPPPPFNPPLPAPLERLGEVLRRVKGA